MNIVRAAMAGMTVGDLRRELATIRDAINRTDCGQKKTRLIQRWADIRSGLEAMLSRTGDEMQTTSRTAI